MLNQLREGLAENLELDLSHSEDFPVLDHFQRDITRSGHIRYTLRDEENKLPLDIKQLKNMLVSEYQQ